MMAPPRKAEISHVGKPTSTHLLRTPHFPKNIKNGGRPLKERTPNPVSTLETEAAKKTKTKDRLRQ